jgi:sulfite reductase (NADPH) hemoprotein beta-component
MSSEKFLQLSKNEVLKKNDPTLAGTLLQTLENPETDHMVEDDEQFLKFHGIYQQDDRDLRKTGKRYSFMVRARIPAGIVPAKQYLVFDALASAHGNSSLRLTSRQSIQWHGVVKTGLRPLIKCLNEALVTTIAACGDVNRNVMASPTPATSPLGDRVIADALSVNQALLPTTRAYHEIWIDGQELKLDAEEKRSFEDPLYGKQYLPRKFKVAFAIPPLNDTDIFSNCLGFVAIADPRDPTVLLGYNLLVGGGQGMSHGNAATFPRVADVLGFVPADRVVDAARAVLKAYRDSGDRTNRKHARLKYVLADHGVTPFRTLVEQHAGFSLEAPQPARFERQGDRFGWHRQTDGRWFLGLYIETGRVADTAKRRTKTALRLVAERFAPEYRITATQNLLITGIAEDQRAAITTLLAEHGLPVENQASATRLTSMACVALPTCSLALAESERVLPSMLERLEALLAELGLADEEIIVRSTGCPNGCARPYMAEIAFVGRAPGKYSILLGGGGELQRLNREYRNAVKVESLMDELRPVLTRWKQERLNHERFGDFVARVIWPEAPAA